MSSAFRNASFPTGDSTTYPTEDHPPVPVGDLGTCRVTFHPPFNVCPVSISAGFGMHEL